MNCWGGDELVGGGRRGTLSKVPGSLHMPTAPRRDQGPGSPRWTQPLLPGWVALGKLVHLSGHQFPSL